MNEEKVSIHYNDKVVLQLYSPDESPYFQFSMPHGNAVFRDVLLDKSLNQKVKLFIVKYVIVSLDIFASLLN